MFKLINYKKEIIAIANKQNVSWDVAARMFLANVRNFGVPELPYYSGADEVPYAALKEKIPAQGTQEYSDMCREFDRAFRAKE